MKTTKHRKRAAALALLLPLGYVLVGCQSGSTDQTSQSSATPPAAGKSGTMGGSAAPASAMARPPGESSSHAGGQAGK